MGVLRRLKQLKSHTNLGFKAKNQCYNFIKPYQIKRNVYTMIRKLSENFHWITFGLFSMGFGILNTNHLVDVNDESKKQVFDFITTNWFGLSAIIVGVLTLIMFWPYKNKVLGQKIRQYQGLVVALLLAVWFSITIGALLNRGSLFLSFTGLITILHILIRAYTD